MALKITDENYEKYLFNHSKPVVLDFWAQWCGPCKTVSDSIESLATEYGEKVIMGKIDVDANPKLTAMFGVRNMPTVLFVKNKEVLNKHVGSTSKLVLEEKLKLIL